MADANLNNFLPNFSMIDISGILTNVFYVIMFGVVVFIFMRMAQHRRIVRIYEKVRGGFVITTGRYNIAYHKEDNREYLRPMMGKKRLPPFPIKDWQKVKSIPLIGVKRILNLIKMNNNSYQVMLPPSTGSIGELKYRDTLTWVFLDEKAVFINKWKKQQLLYLLSVLAPSVIIVGSILFWGLAIYWDASTVTYAKNEISKATEEIIKYMTK